METSAEGRNTDRAGRRDQRHYQYLKENKPTVVNVMRMNGNLKSYLREVSEQAEEMLFQLVKQMAKNEGVDEAILTENRRYKHLLSLMGRNRDELAETLTDKQQETPEKYDEAMNEMHSLAEVEAFSYGFRLGVKLDDRGGHTAR